MSNVCTENLTVGEIELVTKLMMFLCIILLSTLEMVQSKFVDSCLLVFYHQTQIISVLSPDSNY